MGCQHCTWQLFPAMPQHWLLSRVPVVQNLSGEYSRDHSGRSPRGFASGSFSTASAKTSSASYRGLSMVLPETVSVQRGSCPPPRQAGGESARQKSLCLRLPSVCCRSERDRLDNSQLLVHPLSAHHSRGSGKAGELRTGNASVPHLGTRDSAAWGAPCWLPASTQMTQRLDGEQSQDWNPSSELEVDLQSPASRQGQLQRSLPRA